MKRIRIMNSLTLIGAGLAVFFWIFEAAIHAFVFGHGSLQHELLPHDANEIWMRSLVCVILFSFSVYAQIIVKQLRLAKAGLQQSHDELESRVKKRTAELETANHCLEAEIEERKRAEDKVQDYHKRLRSLASELSLAEEHQRRLIAMELHDNAGQELAFVLMKLQLIRQTVNAENLTSLDEVCAVVRKVVENMRGLTFEICSPTLYKFGLEVAIAELLDDKLGAQDGVSYDLNNAGKAIALSDDVKVVMFQSVRELINNVIKHAQAQHVEVDVRRCEDTMKITVNDDGVGFNLDELESPERTSRGFGLFSIAERLKHIGGRFEFRAQPGQGSVFTLEAPIQADMDL